MAPNPPQRTDHPVSFWCAQRAVSEWSALTQDQKKAYGEEYRAAHPEAAAHAEGADGGGADGGGDDAALEAQAQLLLAGAQQGAAQAAGSDSTRKVGGLPKWCPESCMLTAPLAYM